jgi:ribosome-associated toxin RatA of RatAB toxin-antitoxin module
LYALVDDFASYPRRFAWCEKAEVVERADDHVIARLTVRVAGLSATFTTRNTLAPPERISIQLVEGPFSKLEGVWEFRALGTEGTKISLGMDFAVAGKWAGSALAAGFHRIADHMVDDFVRAALAEPA